MITEVNDANFNVEVLQSTIPVLVDFWAEWCGPCRALGPIIDEIASKNEGKLRVVKLDIDASPDTTNQQEIQAVPTMIIFKGGLKVATMVGLRSELSIQTEINKHL